MCNGPEQSQKTTSSVDAMKDGSAAANQDPSDSLLELAANNDVEGFERLLKHDTSAVDEVGFWYARRKGCRQMVLEHRTPLMVAATYGSLDVLKLILTRTDADVNLSSLPDKCTVLHCAAAGGSVNAVEVVELLLASGADPNAVDANGLRPVDVIVVPPKLTSMRASLVELLSGGASNGCGGNEPKLRVSISTSMSSSPPLSSSPECGSPFPSDLVPLNGSPTSPAASQVALNSNDIIPANPPSEKKEYPIDPSIPDIKNSIYSTDEFRMFSFKVRPCSRAYSHDWTECPFVHPGENARRRDPRKYHYSCVPCPEFRKGTCRRGDMCEYAHGVFECWLHPAQYRTRLCKDGTSCNRRVCFFAHMPEELRPLYVSTGSAVPSPRASSAGVMDMAAALNHFPGSPSSVSALSPSPFSPQAMSPSANNGGSHLNGAWPQGSVPTLYIPGSNNNNLQSSRLRSSLSARDIPPEDLHMLSEFEVQQQMLYNELAGFSRPRGNPSPSLMRSGSRSQTLAPSNLEEIFASEVNSSPRYSDQAANLFSPSHKSAILNQFQQQQSMLSPINTNNAFSPRNVEPHPLLQASLGASSPGRMSPGRMSPRSVEQISPMAASRLSAIALQEKQQHMRSLSARDLGQRNMSSAIFGSPPVIKNPWSDWGSPSGTVDWSVNNEGGGIGKMRRSSSFELGNNGEEPDLSWVQSLVKESPPEVKVNSKVVGDGSGAGALEAAEVSADDSVIGAWLEQMQLDQHLVN